MSSPSTAAPPPQTAKPAKRKYTLAAWALLTGIAAFVFAWIPGLSFVAWLPAAAAITLGIISLAKRPEGRGKAISGIVLSATGWLVAIVVSIATIGVAASGNNTADSALTPAVTSTPTPTVEPVNEADLAALDEAPADPNSATPYKDEPSVAVTDTTATSGLAIDLPHSRAPSSLG